MVKSIIVVLCLVLQTSSFQIPSWSFLFPVLTVKNAFENSSAISGHILGGLISSSKNVVTNVVRKSFNVTSNAGKKIGSFLMRPLEEKKSDGKFSGRNFKPEQKLSGQNNRTSTKSAKPVLKDASLSHLTNNNTTSPMRNESAVNTAKTTHSLKTNVSTQIRKDYSTTNARDASTTRIANSYTNMNKTYLGKNNGLGNLSLTTQSTNNSPVLTLAAAKKKVKQKCRQYARMFYKTQHVKPNAVAMLNSISARRIQKADITCSHLGTPLIVGGKRAKENEFPHQAEIGFSMDPKKRTKRRTFYTCGGSLISEHFVLTAAHCVQDVDGRGLPTKVRFGYVSKLRNKNRTHVYSVDKIFTHPAYIPHSEVRYHDIALLKTKARVKFTESIRPACLETQDVIRQPRAVASGFGKTNFLRARGSNHLMKATIDVVNVTLCRKLDPEFNATTQLCAGVLAGGRDTCQGDSGGPLQVLLKQPSCMYSVIGVTSYGKQCAMVNAPSVYTRVSFYLPWISGIVWPEHKT